MNDTNVKLYNIFNKSTSFLLVFSQLCKFSNLGRVVLEKCVYSRMRLLFIKNHYNLQSQNLSRLCFHLSHFYTFSMKIFLKFRSFSTKNIDISNQYFGDSFMSPRDYFEQHSKTGKKYFKTGFFICLYLLGGQELDRTFGPWPTIARQS